MIIFQEIPTHNPVSIFEYSNVKILVNKIINDNQN